MTLNLIIILSSLWFFYIYEQKPRFYFHENQRSTRAFMKGLPDPKSAGERTFVALVTGERKVLKASEKELYMRLGITHIFTPSGMHLSTLTIFFKRTYLFRLFCVALSIVMGVICLFPAMSRVLALKSCSKTSYWFFIILLLEGATFSWQKHFPSWICSWLFLGLCYFSPNSHKALWFSLGQMILSHVFFQVWSPIGIILNLLLFVFLKLIFPISLAVSLIPIKLDSYLIPVFDGLVNLLYWIDQIHKHINLFVPHMGHLIFMYLWIELEGKKRLVILPLVLILLSTPLNQMKIHHARNNKWELVEGSKVRCKYKWINQRWEEICRPDQGTAKKLANFH